MYNVIVKIKKGASRKEQSMRAITEIKNLQEKTPLFREFCEINGLKDGDYYSVIDYIDYYNELSMSEILKITQKYEPNFKSVDLGF